ncbi:OLC1v1028319C3 [Oldenlandia corymbosa var. corymbosa]|uniref:OLC1v1028319C3 n=1 Tax=Oldenlandia corymbosa var. corymbosa TaxID=529605 RepID=A0AAV1CCM1_OLDCO|nr:OLC1v1028319C3 [Oldenlandia corymbosa var. corymbosa]
MCMFCPNYATVSYGFTGDPVNHFGKEQTAPILRPNKRSREAEVIASQQKLQISLNNNIYHDEMDRTARIPCQNPVSTGLRLSYDDEEHNSSVTSASGSMTAASSIIWSANDNIRAELDRQREEFDQYIKTQEEFFTKGIRDMKKRHMASFLSAIEKGVGKKLHEKDLELENINRKNKELAERMKQVAADAQQWCYRAKYNESVVNILKANLQQALQGAADQGKEGFGDSENDDAASCIDPNNHLNMPSGSGKLSAAVRGNMICRTCKKKEVSVLLMPCRHLCLCIDCEGLVSVCPVCQMFTTGSVQVYLS